MNDLASKPSPDQLTRALLVAGQLRDANRDPDFVGRSLLYLQHRQQELEHVLTAAEHYLNSGLGEHEHSVLVLAIRNARESEDRATHIESPNLGLG